MESERQESRRAEKRTVLVVDDEPNVVEIVARIVRELGFHAYESTTGAEALELTASAPPDLIIADIAMPVMRGPQLVAQARELGRWCPVLFLSGELDVASIDSSLSMPRAMFLPKPFTRKELVDAVWAAMKL